MGSTYDRNGMCLDCGGKAGEHGPRCSYEDARLDRRYSQTTGIMAEPILDWKVPTWSSTWLTETPPKETP